MRYGVVPVLLLRSVLCVWALAPIPRIAGAQGHVHDAPPARQAMTDLLLEGPHLILHHRFLLALADSQQVVLRRAQRALCGAEVEFVRRRDDGRTRLAAAVADTGMRRLGMASRGTLRPALDSIAAAEEDWLTALMRARRDALALLSPRQRAELEALRQHWAREAGAMIEEATRPGQRGHPGMQIPVRVPGMVVDETVLIPYCESLHGPAVHISVPPPR